MMKYRRRLFYLYLKIWFSRPVQNACVFRRHFALEFWNQTRGFLFYICSCMFQKSCILFSCSRLLANLRKEEGAIK